MTWKIKKTIQAINEAAIQATYQTASIYKFSSKSTWSKKKTTRLLRPAKPLIENCDNVTSVSERNKILIQKQLCFNRTSINHRAEECHYVTKY